ncbi:MAG: NmrA family NAD(P)-binding protein [Rhodospirillaceae bacterium]
MVTLVFGGTGKVGSAAVRRLVEKGRTVRVFTHSPDKLSVLPSGVEAAQGDLDKPETIPAAFVGVDEVMLILAVNPAEQARGLAVVEAAKAAGVKRLVFLSLVHGLGTEKVPFYQSKLTIEAAFKQSGMAWAIVRSSSFFQSDAGLKSEIVDQGVFSAPIGSVGVNRIDTRDVGYAMAEALTKEPFETGEFRVFGPDSLTGDSIAEIYSKLLGKPIRYYGDDLDKWAEFKKGAFPPWSLNALRHMYAATQQTGMKPEQGEAKSSLLPDELITFEKFARELMRTGTISVK